MELFTFLQKTHEQILGSVEYCNQQMHNRKQEHRNHTITGEFKINYLTPKLQMNVNSVFTPKNLHPANKKQPTRHSRTSSLLSDHIITDKMIIFQYFKDNLLCSDQLGHNALLDDVVTRKQSYD